MLKVPRTILTSLLSYGIASGVFFVFNLALPRWLSIISLLHGALLA